MTATLNAANGEALSESARRGNRKAIGDLLGLLAGRLNPVPGTVEAGKAVIVSAAKLIDTITVTTLKVGVTAASTGSNISNTGITTCGSSAGANPTFHLDAPVAGVRKELVSIGASTGTVISSTGSGATFNSTATGVSNKATFVGLGQALQLVGLSTSSWGVVGIVGAPAFSS
jgi:hypothetical protein